MRLSGCVYVGRTGIDSARNRYIRVHGFNALGGVVAILMFCVFACGSKGSCSEEVRAGFNISMATVEIA